MLRILHYYTVVLLHTDGIGSYTAHVQASSTEEAVDRATQQLQQHSEDNKPVQVMAVFAGYQENIQFRGGNGR